MEKTNLLNQKDTQEILAFLLAQADKAKGDQGTTRQLQKQ